MSINGKKPHPKDVYDNPDAYSDFFAIPSDDEFEGQHFDRKEACRLNASGKVEKQQLNALKTQIIECISAFANKNHDGGLLVLGISKTGVTEGIDHLLELQQNSLTDFSSLLRNHGAIAKHHNCQDKAGVAKTICLIYTPYVQKAICETLTQPPKAWIRHGKQNVLLNDEQREQLKRDKQITDFEQSYCCSYDERDVDKGVLDEFRKVFLSGANYADDSDEEILYRAGALKRDGDTYAFTNAGFLFFSSNPQRLFSWANIRLLRFEVELEKAQERGTPTADKQFSGPITKQIRDIRTFLTESAFFKVYQRRNPKGGFIDEQEFPFIAVDEAIVNAVAHRDYSIQLQIECEYYRDAFVVRNSGYLKQRDKNVPEHFSLEDIRLDSAPRNPKLIEWLKLMRDKEGAAFVRALSEGTRRMRDEMLALHLPAPTYDISQAQTSVTLFNNSKVREAELQADFASTSTEFANLFPLSFKLKDGGNPHPEYLRDKRNDFLSALRDKLSATGWYIDSLKFGRLTAHRQGQNITVDREVERFIRFFPAYSFQVYQFKGRFYLSIDYTLEIRNIQTLQALLKYFDSEQFSGKPAVVNWNGWQRGKVLSTDSEWARVYLFDFDQEETILSNKVIPSISLELIETQLHQSDIKFDLYRERKKHSLALEPGASRTRAEKTLNTAREVSDTIFPLEYAALLVGLDATPAPLVSRSKDETALRVNSLQEPKVEFFREHESTDIRAGITEYGTYEHSPKNIEIIPICIHTLRKDMAVLIERLKVGKYKYKGAERTFGTSFTYASIITVSNPEDVFGECERLLREHPNWVGDEKLNRLFLVHTPERGYSSDDEASPYYTVKRLLLEKGIPCQMVDTPTIKNPDWKDLNLALNITAKCGVTPWVLPDVIPDADFFIGLSYTQTSKGDKQRVMGFANVFNHYGRWEFYMGNTSAFSYEERIVYFRNLVKNTLERLSLSETPNIYFHYSAKFSRDDRRAILEAARSIRPRGTYSFVWINTGHGIRLYDSRVETDGSLSRGSYVATSHNQIYLSTTGYNQYRKVLGTPKMLEVNIWVEPPENVARTSTDLKALAKQILSLTKLNWGSTDSFVAEPITIKYASNIAYLTAAFLRQQPSFSLHPVLEKTPWFV